MQRIVIIGGGVGGTVTANLLSQKLKADIETGKVRIQMITDSEDHVYKPAFLYLALGRTEPGSFRRKQRELLNPAVDLVVERAVKVDTQDRVVVTDADRAYRYDHLVIATGTRVAPEETPGLAKGGEWFYTEDGAKRLCKRLNAFSGGRIVVSVIGVPHMCPVAPLEITFMLEAFFRERQRRDQVEIVYTYPINRVHTIPSCAEWASGEFEKRGIESRTFFNVERVDPDTKSIETMEGDSLSYDLLIGIPEHKSARFLEDSGLTKGGWVPTGRHTLEVEGLEDVYAIGDTTNLPVSKAGSVAHYQASVVAANIASRIMGRYPAERYMGKTFCFIESGLDEATFVEFDYEHPAVPVTPSKFIHWSKLAYNQSYWLTAKGVL